jgi:chromosome segregation ATPase
MAKAWLAAAQKRMAALHNEMADLRIRYDEAVTVAKESREKLAALVEHAHRDQEEAQKAKSERNELSQASKQLQADLDSVRLEHEYALGERDEAHQECNIALREKITAEDKLKETTHVAARVAEENSQLKSEVGSLWPRWLRGVSKTWPGLRS